MTSALARNSDAQARGSVTPWSPFQDLLGFDPFQNFRSNWAFEYDLTRTETGYEVEIPVPGYSASQIEVTFKDGLLNVTGRNERRHFTRSFSIPDDIDSDQIQGKVTDGMLHLTLNRRPEAQPKRITIG